eukprot:Opistho-2@93467
MDTTCTCLQRSHLTPEAHTTQTHGAAHTYSTDKVLSLQTDCAYPSANASSACSPIRVHPTHKIKIHQSPPDQPPVKQHAPRLHVAVHIAGRVETQQGLERIAQKAQAHYGRSFGRRSLRIEPVQNQPVLAPITTTWHVCTQRHNRVVVRKLEQNRNFKLTPPALHHNGKVISPRTNHARVVDDLYTSREGYPATPAARTHAMKSRFVSSAPVGLLLQAVIPLSLLVDARPTARQFWFPLTPSSSCWGGGIFFRARLPDASLLVVLPFCSDFLSPELVGSVWPPPWARLPFPLLVEVVIVADTVIDVSVADVFDASVADVVFATGVGAG